MGVSKKAPSKAVCVPWLSPTTPVKLLRSWASAGLPKQRKSRKKEDQNAPRY
jgi:hypothetical protein